MPVAGTPFTHDAWIASEEQSNRPEVFAPLTKTLQSLQKRIIEVALAASGEKLPSQTVRLPGLEFRDQS
jgi:hypothetical protein